MRTMFGVALAAAVGVFSAAARADHEGPHKGIVVEWGEEEYHVELVTDAKAGTVTAYVYGDEKDLGKGKTKPIDSKTLTLKTSPATTLKLEPAPEKDDPTGKSSKFTGKNDVFTKGGKLEGTVSGKVGDKPYTGTFKQK